LTADARVQQRINDWLFIDRKPQHIRNFGANSFRGLVHLLLEAGATSELLRKTPFIMSAPESWRKGLLDA
jgi:hypothetical protein